MSAVNDGGRAVTILAVALRLVVLAGLAAIGVMAWWLVRS